VLFFENEVFLTVLNVFGDIRSYEGSVRKLDFDFDDYCFLCTFFVKFFRGAHFLVKSTENFSVRIRFFSELVFLCMVWW